MNQNQNSQVGGQGPTISAEAIKNAQQVKCDCGGIVFNEKLTFKKISKILSPTGKEEMVPMPIIVCDKCELVPSVFDPQNMIPKELKANKTKMEVKK